MANETKNYKFLKPETDDFYDIREYNKTMDALDDSLTEMNESKLDKAGDASQAVTEFEEEVLRENIESGETLSTTHGKVKKWFSEMKDVAFSGKAKDIIPDASHRFVTEKEKGDWDGKVAALGGDISETVIENLETINTKYPVPAAGETTKVFMGKVEKFINDFKDHLNVAEVTLTAVGWSSPAPYTQTVDVLGITEDDRPIASLYLPDGITAENVKLQSKAYGCVDRVATGAGKITAYCYNKKPAVDFQIQIKGV
nr:MAG TPA: hypothetical protein [Caudoviricetes sp.]